VREDEELREKARASREETRRLRDETLGGEADMGDGADLGSADDDGSPLPEKRDPEPWAKTSSGDTEHVTDDDSA
jgi:hypothetical protein